MYIYISYFLEYINKLYSNIIWTKPNKKSNNAIHFP